MRTQYPSLKWQKSFAAAAVINGAHYGERTIEALTKTYGVPMYLLGATPAAAGLAAGIGYQMRGQLEHLQEMAAR